MNQYLITFDDNSSVTLSADYLTIKSGVFQLKLYSETGNNEIIFATSVQKIKHVKRL